ncbi:xanthan lyase [Hoylesella timonensis]|uniref:Xanthan lyase n=1 Tax=Hoylesella timonensis TaxID=386414 RepID=A0A2K0XKR6_9BACT|nr:N-acetylmuramoyl-L-alanine amidase [Hoylesella timonensis]PNP95124.1 xanthan lyase [Hoylesella timonensis]
MRTFGYFLSSLSCLLFGLQTFADNPPTTFAPTCQTPLVQELTSPNRPKYGLSNRHIAMWQSHGRYYEAKLDRWEWQRCRLLQTVEDLYTQSYVLPFLVPMLEQAGANVLIPRERDWSCFEAIVDNDGNSFQPKAKYNEYNGKESWKNGTGKGFAYLRKTYTNFENPFTEGTYRMVTSIKNGQESKAEWIPQIDQTGEYAVYVAYHTVPGSTNAARYTVYHRGGISEFKVNQQMGGGTWIYLGKFVFDKNLGKSQRIVLSNKTGKAGEVVTADAIKIGGGMGNIGRPEISTYPRFTEAARYWMQWAGVPDSIYSPTAGKDDYKDDYQARGEWVNWLAGGSESYPEGKGLNIPIEMSLAFHTDAGVTKNDSTIGTLGIYFTHSYDSVFANGASRQLCKEYAETIHNSILRDIRAQFEPTWRSRGNKDASYFEARTPRVPAMLLELLSHQNFADMRYGHDPRFRFAVSRAIYKAMLRFSCKQHQQKYMVTPLPVSHMAAHLTDKGQVELTWKAVEDTLEPTAKPDRYIVYTRYGNGEFDHGKVVKQCKYVADVPSGMVCSYKVVAMNEGGVSFPSQIVAVGRSAKSHHKKALIVNGFDRISAPADFEAPTPLDTLYAGFLDSEDHGVPYMVDISYVGSQKEFNRSLPWLDDDSGGFGDSHGNEETTVIAGNTFDYIALHGDAILKAGYSFESCSRERFNTFASDISFVDLILGKQRQTKLGSGKIYPLCFKTFTPEVQQLLTAYAQQGTSIFVSGAYVASDLWNNKLAKPQEADLAFAKNILKYQWRNSKAAITGRLSTVRSPLNLTKTEYTYAHTLNPNTYIVEAPDAIEPACDSAYTVMRYPENNLSAAVAYRGAYKTFVMGIPFESIMDSVKRKKLMAEIIRFFE